MAMLCNVFQDLWQKFEMWVTLEWTPLTFGLLVSILGVVGCVGLLTFFKKSYGKADKPPKWGTLVVAILMFIILAIVCAARFV